MTIHTLDGRHGIDNRHAISKYTTEELIAELSKRDKVESFDALWGYHVAIKNARGRNNGTTSTDVATILVIKK